MPRRAGGDGETCHPQSCGEIPDRGPDCPDVRRADRRRHPPVGGPAVSAGCHLRRQRHQLLPVQQRRRGRRAVPDRPRRRRAAHRPDRGRWPLLAHLPARPAPRSALRLSGPRAVGPGARAVVQPGQAAARPVRQDHRRIHRLGSGLLRLRLRRPRSAQHGRQRPPRVTRRRARPVLRLGQRPPAGDRDARDDHLRGPRQRADLPPPGRSRGAAGHLRRHGPPRRHRTPHRSRHHRHRADAGPPVHPRPPPGRAGAAQLLGLQLGRLPRAAQRLLVLAPPAGSDPGPGAGVQDDGQGPAPSRHRGHPRRRLQPHRRGQPHGPDAVDAGHRQPGLLPGRRRAPPATTSTSRAPATASTCATRTCCS